MTIEDDGQQPMFTTSGPAGDGTEGQSKSNKEIKLSSEDVQSAYMYIDLLQKQLAKAQDTVKSNAGALLKLENVERERDRYRATVLSLAYQNKVVNDELSKTRKVGQSKEEKYYDAKLQVADLKEALRLKEREVEELKESRDFMPTSDAELLASFQRMREVFESLRSTLCCPLCYEVLGPGGDVKTLSCGHSLCARCLQTWSERQTRLYNLATTPDCPECRTSGRHAVKVYMLEEVVRTVDRLERLEAENEANKQAVRKAALDNESQEQGQSKEEQDLVSG